jgi:hypothetical protein
MEPLFLGLTTTSQLPKVLAFGFSLTHHTNREISTIIVVVWGLLLLAVILTAIGATQHFKRKTLKHARHRFCPKCGYDLRATPECCPECGTNVSAARL